MSERFTETLHRWVPAIGSLRGYNASMFRRDFFAGVTVAAVAVPQAIAYAKIFGMPAEMGLYTAIVMTSVGAMLDSSKQLINGPTNAISIAMLSALASIDGDERRRSAAILMALLVGLIQTAISLGRFGDLSRFISKAVIVGFTLGASALLLMDQLKNVLGLQVTTDPHDHFLLRFWKTINSSEGVHWPTFFVALSTAAIALGIRWFNRRFSIWLPEFLIAIVAVSAGLYWMDPLRELQVKLTESVPSKLPWFSLPAWDWMMVWELSGSALIGKNPSHFQGAIVGNENADLPVEQVSWDDAVAFCKKLSDLPDEKKAGRVYRLPTEAEWEYACRVGSKTAYSFDDEEGLLPEYGWFNRNSSDRTHTVGLLEPNAWGLYDMHGNVWEWCRDWNGEYPKGAVSDPTGPTKGSHRVIRGGCWILEAALCRSANRHGGSPSSRSNFNGFRLALNSPSGIPK